MADCILSPDLDHPSSASVQASKCLFVCVLSVRCLDEPTNVFHPFGQLADHQSHMMQIGISVETVTALAQLTPAVEQTLSTVDSYRQFCMQMVQNCFNYLASFSVKRGQMAPGSLSEEFVPLAQLRMWYENFERRLMQNPNFWKS